MWSVRDDAGHPVPLTADGVRAQPFWSLRSRAERILERVPDCAGFTAVEIPLDAFRSSGYPAWRMTASERV